MSFVRMRNAVSHLLPKVYEHPFNEALLKGTLPMHVFRFYLEQDFLYLGDFAKALILVSNRSGIDTHAHKFKIFSEEVYDTQRNLHLKYLGEPRPLIQLSPRQFSVKKIPAISQYTKHLIRTAYSSPIEESVASLIPCFWLYSDLGRKMLSTPGYNTQNPYHSWILSYSSEHFTSSAKSIIHIVEEVGTKISCPIKRKNMELAFVKSIEYEILFLDSVYEEMDISNEFLRQKKFELRRI